MEFVDAHGAKQRVRDLLRSSAKADLVVAFWGDGAIDELGIRDCSLPLHIVCNLETGSTNPSVIAELQKMARQKAGITVAQNDRLHSKIYLFDDTVIIGSSNASTNGLAFEGGELTHWMEANVVSSDPGLLKATREWIDALGRREISAADLKRARAAWKARRSIVRMPRDVSTTILEAMRFEPEAIAGLPIFLAVYEGDLSDEAKDREQALKRSWGTDRVSLFEDFGALPDDGLILAFEGKAGSYRWQGAWERRGKTEDQILEKNRNAVQLVWRADDVFGKVPFHNGERAAWSEICSNAMGQPLARRDGSICIRLSKAAANLLPADLRTASFETDVWRSIHALEAALRLEGRKGATLGRTRLKISRVGEQQTVADLLRGKASRGFGMLVDRGLLERTFEAVALRHPQLFDEDLLNTATTRLQQGRAARP